MGDEEYHNDSFNEWSIPEYLFHPRNDSWLLCVHFAKQFYRLRFHVLFFFVDYRKKL
jgi:hypothetical protein